MKRARVTTLEHPWRTPLPERMLLWLALLQGSSFTLSVALNLPSGLSATLAALVTLLWAMMYLFATVGLFAAYGVDWLTWLVRYRLPLSLLVAVTLFSAFWSIDPRLSIERGLHLAGSTIVAVYIGMRIPLHEIVRITSHVFAILIVLSIGASLFLPELGLARYEGTLVWRGVMASKNTLGFWAAIAVMLFLYRMAEPQRLSGRLGWALMTVLALVCLVMSVSATSVLALVVASLMMLYVYATTELDLGAFPMILLGVIVTVLAFIAFRSIDTAELIGRSGDLTGRTEVWQETWRLILSRPLTGFGYGTIWFPTETSVWIQESLTDIKWTVYHAHNGLLQIGSEIGLPATALMLVMLGQQLIETFWCQYRRPQPGLIFVLGFIVALLVSNYSEARLLVNRDLFWIYLVALPISMLQQVTLVSSESASPFSSQSVQRDRGGASPRRETLAQRRDLKKRLRQRRLESHQADEDVVAEQPPSRAQRVPSSDSAAPKSAAEAAPRVVAASPGKIPGTNR